MTVLALNAGSSTLKFGLYGDDGGEVVAGAVEWPAEGGDPKAAVARLLGRVREASPGEAVTSIQAVGHRVVHGGAEFAEPVVIDGRVRDAITRFADLAPLHNPAALACVAAVEAALPGVPQVAVFDTALYAALSPRAFLYPVPYEWYTAWGVRRFGFHGISHGYCLRRAAELCGRDARHLRIVSCHLGAGCSATAFRAGTPAATTMGFTPLDGLMMATRPGAIDSGVLTHLVRSGRLTADQLADALEHRAGLLGVSGVSADYRQVEAAAREGNGRAGVALDMFADRVRSAVGGLAVTLGGLDALVFTGGIGEHSAALRAAVCDGLGCLGVRLADDRNRACRPDSDVAESGSGVRVLVVAAQEEAEVARDAARCIGR